MTQNDPWEHEPHSDNDLCNNRWGWGKGHHVCILNLNHEESHQCSCGAENLLMPGDTND